MKEAVSYYWSPGPLGPVVTGLLFAFLDRLLEIMASFPGLGAAGCGSEFDLYI